MTDEATDQLSASEHRRILAHLSIEYAVFMERLPEFDARTTWLLLDALISAMTPHMRALGTPESVFAEMQAARDRYRAKVADVRGFLEHFNELAASDPQGAERLLAQFVTVGRFIQAERATPFKMPKRIQ